MSTFITQKISSPLRLDLQEKMVFIGGPRQVGKTILAQSLIKNFYPQHPAYLNWDDTISRKKILTRQWSSDQKLIIFDEIHKYQKWKSLVKGHYDILKTKHSFLITGSAKLNVFRRGEDSLLGRYYYYRLHPLSMSEVGYSQTFFQKLYMFDWTSVQKEGSRFENLVASHLLKYCHFLQDTEGEKKGVSSSIKYFRQKIKIPQYYQVHTGNTEASPFPNVSLLPFIKLAQKLKL